MMSPDFPGLNPQAFFGMRAELYRLLKGGKLGAKHRLPTTGDMCGEELFAEVSAGWDAGGIVLQVVVNSPCLQTVYPKVSRGDAIELFFDTRNVKTSGFNTRFCHHFFFLPKPVDGVSAGEITVFRSDDAHELCDEKKLSVKSFLKKSSYTMDIAIPASCLVGYDPTQFQQLGFSYRISRAYGAPQHFSASSEEYDIGQQPSLWASMTLK